LFTRESFAENGCGPFGPASGVRKRDANPFGEGKVKLDGIANALHVSPSQAGH